MKKAWFNVPIKVGNLKPREMDFPCEKGRTGAILNPETPMRPLLRASLLFIALGPVFSAAQSAALFDLSAEHALTDDEKQYLLDLEHHRYLPLGRSLQDTEAPPPEPRLLTTSQVAELLLPRTRKIVADLKEKQGRNKITDADRGQALVLWWYRRGSLPEEDQSFLKNLNPERSFKEPVSAAAPPRGGPIVAATGAIAKADDLAARLAGQLILENHGDPKQSKILREAIAGMLESPLARKLAEEFIAQDVPVEVSFEPVENSEVIERNGKKIITGSGGNMHTESTPPHAVLNRDYLQSDASYRVRELPETLGHELLGHGLESIKAKKAGVDRTYNFYEDNETNAGLVGWIISAERHVYLDDSHMRAYLRDPEEYHAELQVSLPYYARTYSRAEMDDVIPVLKKRLARAKKKMGEIAQEAKNTQKWRAIADHMITVHKTDAKKFHSLLENMDSRINIYGPRDQNDLQRIVDALEGEIRQFSLPQGAAALKKMQDDAKNPFFTQQDERIAKRREALSKLVESEDASKSANSGRGKTSVSAPFAPPPPGQYEWDDLDKMYRRDLEKHPEHWNQK